MDVPVEEVAGGFRYERTLEHASAVGEMELEHVPSGLNIESDRK